MGSCLEKIFKTKNQPGHIYQNQSNSSQIFESPLKNQKKFENIYKLSHIICKGQYGNIRKCIHIVTNVIRAVKIINKVKNNETLVNQWRVSVDQMRELDHPNILKIYEFFENKDSFYVVMEYCVGGDIFANDKHKELNEVWMSQIFKDILSTLLYLHNKDIQHRNLKPTKILFPSSKNFNTVQINCLDLSIGSNLKQPFSIRSQQHYLAPEILLKKMVSRKADIWACGIMLYSLVCGHSPYQGTNQEAVQKEIIKGVIRLESQEWQYESIYLKDLVKDMLHYNPQKRISAKKALKNIWISKTKPPNALPSKVKQTREKQALMQMRRYKPQSEISSSIAGFLLSNLDMKQEKEKIIQTFQQMDKNNDGLLTVQEITKGLKKIMSEVEAEVEAKKIMTQIDTNGNGTIDFSEFLSATMAKNQINSDKNIKSAFDLLDQDKNGYITVKELQIVLKYSSDLSDLKDLVLKYDQDGDQKISFNEFKRMMQELI